ncbi:hypothetical protein LTR85_008053 [Meristemomyces frigidus]|nr:hypothetical protein LTR85_008053 [Meristemomyces frigidus]
MASNCNLTRYYYNEYDNAVRCFKDGDLETAEDLCAALVTDSMCPRFVQIQAWQLRSTCTDDYSRAKTLLESALKMFEIMNEDELVLKRRAATGEDPPEEEQIEHAHTTDEAEPEAGVMATALAHKNCGIGHGRDHIVRGGSPETEQLPGGVEAPWIKISDTEQSTTSRDDEAAPPISPPH